ncbi:MAG: hypothetical protein OEM77_03270 [Nitrosopumilus sp.]|nr:hypothetical protein [Nitrosopumilus sp.]MDH3736620.1 hypothetical protein [Nitrosopumilus sp.]MDH3823311.1 hypothetical protein [Nitrosopumilus sp.]MDH3833527.1 hypothetical protein [Nitrosopumilus sp.]
MTITRAYFQNRIFSLRRKIETLTSLPELVSLPTEQDIKQSQWFVIQSQLSSVSFRLSNDLHQVSENLSIASDKESIRDLNVDITKIEMELSKAYVFFDTFFDILSQRLSPKLGLLLSGCDVLAYDALKRISPDFIPNNMPPLVFLDKGAGASILREGVSVPGKAKNPLATIQIPYEKLKQKYLLVSILHETGHQKMASLGLKKQVPLYMKKFMKKQKASELLQGLFSNWTSELFPDFTSFWIIGAAQTISTREILTFSPEMVLKVSPSDPHPPMWLRVQMSIDWCRRLWGFGPWDKWEKEWLELYPLYGSKYSPSEKIRNILDESKNYISKVTDFFFNMKFPELENQSIRSIYQKKPAHPILLMSLVKNFKNFGKLDLRDLSPSEQLAVFVMLKYTENISEKNLDILMTRWLVNLGQKNKKSLFRKI